MTRIGCVFPSGRPELIVLGVSRGSGVDPQVALFSSCAQATLDDAVQSAGQQVQTSAATNQVYYAHVRNSNSAVFGVDALYNLSVTASACQADGLEDDDGVAQARSLAMSRRGAESHFLPRQRRGLGQVQRRRGQNLCIQTSNLSADGDTELVLYDKNGVTELVRNDDYGYGRASRIVWQAPGDGVYFVRVRHHNPTASGAGTQYDLAVQEGFCVPDAAEAGTADDGPGDAAVLAAGATPSPTNSALTRCGRTSATRIGCVSTPWRGAAIDSYGRAGLQQPTRCWSSWAATAPRCCRRAMTLGRGLSANLHYTATVPGTYFVRATQFNSTINGYGTNYRDQAAGERASAPAAAANPDPAAARRDAHARAEQVQTIILVNRARLATVYGAAQADQVMGRLYNLAGHATVQGVVVQVEKTPPWRPPTAPGPRTRPRCRDAGKANSVVGAIRSLLMAFIGNKPNVRHVVIVGDDRIIPFRRVPDRVARRVHRALPSRPNMRPAVVEDGSVRAALAANMVLTDDYLVDKSPSNWEDIQQEQIRTVLPDYAIGPAGRDAGRDRGLHRQFPGGRHDASAEQGADYGL